MNYIKKLFTKPSARSLAQIELEEARRQLLAAQTAKEYAESMANYHSTRISRLEAVLRAAI